MMVVLPIPLLRSLGVGGMVVTATSAAVALTLLPIVLAAAGRRLDRRGVTQRDAGAARAWSAWARIVVRHKWPAALLSGSLLAALAAVATGINLNVPVTADLAPAGPGREGLVALQQGGLPTGALTAFDVFVPAGSDPAAIAAGLGAMVVLWQWGWGTEQLLGIRPDGAIGTFVPVTIFAFLYGLTMDYEVLILSRVREAYRNHRSGDRRRHRPLRSHGVRRGPDPLPRVRRDGRRR
jgi:uncharacterized membrane protein YdfJ with MMPL/SSD domain